MDTLRLSLKVKQKWSDQTDPDNQKSVLIKDKCVNTVHILTHTSVELGSTEVQSFPL